MNTLFYLHSPTVNEMQFSWTVWGSGIHLGSHSGHLEHFIYLFIAFTLIMTLLLYGQRWAKLTTCSLKIIKFPSSSWHLDPISSHSWTTCLLPVGSVLLLSWGVNPGFRRKGWTRLHSTFTIYILSPCNCPSQTWCGSSNLLCPD